MATKYIIENIDTKETFEYIGPFINGPNSYVLDIFGKLIESETLFNYGNFDGIECQEAADFIVTKEDDKPSAEDFIESNYFHLTLDCKRDINDIYDALKTYSEL